MTELKSLKLHILEVLYSSLISKTFDNAVEHVTQLFVQSDSLFRPLLQYSPMISKITSALINSALLYKFSSTFGEFVLNYVRIDTIRVVPLPKLENNNKFLIYVTLNYLLPLIIEIIPKILKSRISANKFEKIQKMIKTVKIVKIALDLIYRLRYIFKNKFLYSDISDHLLGIMLVNQGEKDKIVTMGKQLNMFALFMFIRIGEWYYQKETKNETIDIEPPGRETNKTDSNNISASNKCLICHVESENIKSPHAVRCCGFVFCEQCIDTHLKANSKCPNCLNTINKMYLIKIYN